MTAKVNCNNACSPCESVLVIIHKSKVFLLTQMLSLKRQVSREQKFLSWIGLKLGNGLGSIQKMNEPIAWLKR